VLSSSIVSFLQLLFGLFCNADVCGIEFLLLHMFHNSNTLACL
jgi:hypothetical protein